MGRRNRQEIRLKKKSFAERTGSKRTAIGSALAQGIHFLGEAINTVIKGFVKVARPIISIFGILLIILISIFWLSAAGFILFGYPIASFILPSAPFLTSLGIVNILLVTALPLLSIVFLILRMLYGYRVSKRWHTGLWVLGVVNMVCLFGIGSHLGNQFKIGKDIDKIVEAPVISSDTLKIEMAENLAGDFTIFFNDPRIVDKNLLTENVHVNILKAKGENFEFESKRKARGAESAEAAQLANEFHHQVTFNGNKLQINPYLSIHPGSKWRAQVVYFTIRVPEGKSIFIGENLSRHLRTIDVNTEVDRPWMSKDQVWTMGENGLEIPGYKDEEKKSIQKNFKDFSQLSLSGNMKLQIEKSEDYEVNIKGSKDGKEAVRFEKLDETLLIESPNQNWNSPVRVYIKCPNLEWLELENTNDVKISGFDGDEMKMDFEGDMEVKTYNLNVKNLYVTLKEKVRADFKGKADKLELEMDGQSNFNSEFFTVKNATINSKGYNKPIKLTVTDQLQRTGFDPERWDIKGEPATEDK